VAAIRHRRRGIVLQPLLAVEERGQGVYRKSIPTEVRHPDKKSIQVVETRQLTEWGDDGEVQLDGKAAQDKDAQLPLFPPVHHT